MKEKYHQEDQDIDGRIVLKQVLEKYYDGVRGPRSSSSGHAPFADY
jgi:hypothetical protein